MYMRGGAAERARIEMGTFSGDARTVDCDLSVDRMRGYFHATNDYSGFGWGNNAKQVFQEAEITSSLVNVPRRGAYSTLVSLTARI